MNKKQWNVFGWTSGILSVYFYVWQIMDGIAVMKYPLQASFLDVLNVGVRQQIIAIILFGLSIAFFYCKKLEGDIK